MITSTYEDELSSIGGFETILHSPITPKQSTFEADHEAELTTPITTSFSPDWPSSPTILPEPSTPERCLFSSISASPTTPESSSPNSLLSTPATSFSSSTASTPEHESKAPAAPSWPSPAPATKLGNFASILHHCSHEPATPPIIPAPCLQCSLLNLPCSATHPTCTRCARAHEQDFNGWYGIRDIISPCLAQRRRTMQEILEGKEMGQMEVLCRLEGDGEGMWEQKVEMAGELLRKKVAVDGRRNWVLPVPDRKAALAIEERRGLWLSVDGERWG